MKDETTNLKEVIRQKKALVEFMERDLQEVRQSLDKSIERYLALLQEASQCKYQK